MRLSFQPIRVAYSVSSVIILLLLCDHCVSFKILNYNRYQKTTRREEARSSTCRSHMSEFASQASIGNKRNLERFFSFHLSSKSSETDNQETNNGKATNPLSQGFDAVISPSSLLLEALVAQKELAVEEEDYLRAASLKQQIDDLLKVLPKNGEKSPSSLPKRRSAEREIEQGIIQHWESALPLNTGDNLQFPPMWEIPCSILVTGDELGNGESKPSNETEPFKLKKLIKPPNTDVLWQWYEARGDLQADPSWAELWPSASSLAATLIRESLPGATTSQLSFKDKTVIELGCGLGVVGLTAASLGASRVILMDREPHALHCAMATASINGFDTKATISTKEPFAATNPIIQAAVVDWSSIAAYKDDRSNSEDLDLTRTLQSSNIVAEYESAADVILCSDVLYDFETVADLAKVMDVLLRKEAGGNDQTHDGRMVLVTDPAIERVPGIQQEFCQVLRSLGAKTVDIKLLPPTPSSSTGDGNIGRMSERTVLIQAQW